ncbi:MAG: tryptophan synthase subunit alpha [Mariprofundaceae bacterium]
MNGDRLAACFARCRNEGRAALVGYLTAGDPTPSLSTQALDALAGQADIVEIGMPFSDPMADGPVIQAASERALAAGARMDDVFCLAEQLRASHPDIGIVFMGYANLSFTMGYETFARRARQAGADGVLLVDMPPEESGPCDVALAAHGLHPIRLLAPTSSTARIKLACSHAGGFIYYVSLTGITGANMGDAGEVRRHVDDIRCHTDLPVCVGFGIKTPEQAVAVAEFADGVVIGSHFVSQVTGHLGDGCAMIAAIQKAAAQMRQALEGRAT